MIDAIKFWMAKQVAEVLLFFLVMVVVIAAWFVVEVVTDWARRRGTKL